MGRIERIVVSVVLALCCIAMIACGYFLASMAADYATTPAPAPVMQSSQTGKVSALPPCATGDPTGCHRDADTRNNGLGYGIVTLPTCTDTTADMGGICRGEPTADDGGDPAGYGTCDPLNAPEMCADDTRTTRAPVAPAGAFTCAAGQTVLLAVDPAGASRVTCVVNEH